MHTYKAREQESGGRKIEIKMCALQKTYTYIHTYIYEKKLKRFFPSFYLHFIAVGG